MESAHIFTSNSISKTGINMMSAWHNEGSIISLVRDTIGGSVATKRVQFPLSIDKIVLYKTSSKFL